MKVSPSPQASPLVISSCLLFLSTSVVLFTLALFKLLSFFIMPSLFFDLLFIGFPAGALLAARRGPVETASLGRSLRILLGTIAFSVAACFLCHHFDYLRAHLFEVEIPSLLGQIAVFTGLFVPFFVAYGMSEYVGYRLGMEALRGRMRLVYAIYLFGAAAAYLFHLWALPRVGVSALMATAAAGIAASIAALERGRGRRLPAAIALILLALGPGSALFLGSDHPLERAFLSLYKGRSLQSSREIQANEGAASLYRRWGKYSYCEILWSPRERSLKGLYNDFFQWEYGPGSGFTERSLGAVPLWFVPPGGKAAIIGAGGGRQVRYAQRFGLGKILALEIESGVIAAVRGPLADRFDRVYEAPGVEVHVGEARSFMERTRESFDLIYLPSVGGYPQMMLEPGNLIRTHEAYRTLRDRLNPGGVLAIWYPAGLDSNMVLTDHYVRTLRALDMEAIAYETVDARNGRSVELLILAAARIDGIDGEGSAAPPDGFPRGLRRLPDLKSSTRPGGDFLRILRRFFVEPAGLDPRARGIAAYPEAEPRAMEVFADPYFTPISDEKPFLAGNVRLIFSLEQVYAIFSVLAGVVLAGGAAVYFLLRRRGDPGIPGRPFPAVALLALLLGANFLLVEHYLVLTLFQEIFVFHDALMLGAIAFLVVSGLGSILVLPRFRAIAQLVAAAAILLLLALEIGPQLLAGSGLDAGPIARLRDSLGWSGRLCLLAPAALVTGSLFPALFELAARNPLGVFGLDAIGAALGSLAAFFVPIVFGFRVLYGLSGVVFLVTVVVSILFHRGRGVQAPPLPAPDRLSP